MRGAGSLDLETDPDVTLTLSSPTTRYLLEYSPQVAAWDLNLGVQPAFLNVGTARAEWHGRHLRLSMGETASYGLRSFASLTPATGTGTGTQIGMPSTGAPPPPMQTTVTALPVTTTTILYESSTTVANAALTLRQWTLAASGGYELAGGATSAAQESVPVQRGPIGNASADCALTHTDHLTTTGTASAPTTITTNPLPPPQMVGSVSPATPAAPGSIRVDAVLAAIDEAWHHDWSRTTFTVLRGGVSAGESNGALSPGGVQTSPVADATIVHTFRSYRQTGDIALDVGLQPTVNPILGYIDRRAQLSVAAHYTHGRVALRGQATISESLPPSNPGGARIFYTEVVSSYNLSREVALELGSRSFWQVPTAAIPTLVAPSAGQASTPPVVLAAFQQELAFVALTVRLDRLRF